LCDSFLQSLSSYQQ